jgi:glycosyltransferase involved in cell wall biosynthesis
MDIPKIAIVSGVQGDTRRYRAFHLYEQLRLAGCRTIVGHITQRCIKDWIQSAKIIILQRVSWDHYVEDLLKSARKQKRIIISDVDDLIFDPDVMHWIDSPDFADPIRSSLYRQNLMRNRRTLLESDAVIASTEYLAEQVRKLGKPVWVHRNGFSLEMAALSLQAVESSWKNRKTILGYASGTPTHDRDFALIFPVLINLIKNNKEVFLHLIGHLSLGNKIHIKDYEAYISHLPFVPWRKLPGLLAQFSINLAPLRLDNPFSQSKSEIKYMEAALVKVPTVASPTQAFCYAIRHGDNGLLANNESDWQAALERLIEDRDWRARMGKSAYEDVMQRYAPWTRAVEIVDTLNQILDFLGASVERLEVRQIQVPRMENYRENSVPIEQENLPTLIDRGLYSLRYRGFKTLVGEAWVFLRRLMTPIFPFPSRNQE